jgi:hypothetical protein
VGAFRISNGEEVWRFNIVSGDGEPGADTWGPAPAAHKHGGGLLALDAGPARCCGGARWVAGPPVMSLPTVLEVSSTWRS